MVVVNTLKESNRNNFVFKSTITLLIVLLTLSVQASACNNNPYDDHNIPSCVKPTYPNFDNNCFEHTNLGHITGFVWLDSNKNGIWAFPELEQGISGVTVELYKCDGTYIKNTTTNNLGTYSFEVYPDHTYYVKFILPDGYVFSPKDSTTDKYYYYIYSDAYTDTGKTDCVEIKDVCFGDCKELDAGMYCQPTPEPASVGNYVWNDLNANGTQDSGETGINGVTVKLYTCSGEPVNATTTNSTGYYEFTGLDAGSYYIEFVSPSGYVFSPANQGDEEKDSDAEAGGITSCFTLDAGEYYNVVDAGLHNNEQEIPEFPTVAIPMVAIIGLAFVFGRRKE